MALAVEPGTDVVSLLQERGAVVAMNDIPATHRGARVRLHTINGPRGLLRRCMAENGNRYWRIKLAARWIAAEHFVLDGTGDRVVACAECALPAIVPDDEVLCEPCRRHSGETVRSAAHHFGGIA